MAFAMIGTIIAVGSIAATDKAAGVTSARAAEATGPEGMSTTGVSTQFGTGPNFQWYAYAYSTDTGSTLVYTVPSNQRLQIDDVTINYYGSSGYAGCYLLRGSTGSNVMWSLYLNPHDHYEQSFNNLILYSGEQLRVKTLYGGSYSTVFMITGHWI